MTSVGDAVLTADSIGRRPIRRASGSGCTHQPLQRWEYKIPRLRLSGRRARTVLSDAVRPDCGRYFLSPARAGMSAYGFGLLLCSF